MADPFQNMALMQQLYQQSLSPIDRLGSGLMSLAIDRRNREQALQDEANRQAFQRELLNTSQTFQSQQAKELRDFQADQQAKLFQHQDLAASDEAYNKSLLEKEHDDRVIAANAAAAEKLTQQERIRRQELNADQQEAQRKADLITLRSLLPDQKFPDDMSATDISRQIYQSGGRRLVQFADTYRAAQDAYAAAQGQSAQEVADAAMKQAVGDVVADEKGQLKGTKLTSEMLNRLAQPTSYAKDGRTPLTGAGVMIELQDSLARQKDTKGLALLREIGSKAVADNMAGMAVAAKNSQRLKDLLGNAQIAKDQYEKFLTTGKYDEPAAILANQSLMRDVMGVRADINARGGGGGGLPNAAIPGGGYGPFLNQAPEDVQRRMLQQATGGVRPAGMSPAYAARMGLESGAGGTTQEQAGGGANPFMPPPGTYPGSAGSVTPDFPTLKAINNLRYILSGTPNLPGTPGGPPTMPAPQVSTEPPNPVAPPVNTAFWNNLRYILAGTGGLPGTPAGPPLPQAYAPVAIPPVAAPNPQTTASVALQNSLTNAANLNVAPTAFPLSNPYARPTMPLNPSWSPPQF